MSDPEPAYDEIPIGPVAASSRFPIGSLVRVSAECTEGLVCEEKGDRVRVRFINRRTGIESSRFYYAAEIQPMASPANSKETQEPECKLVGFRELLGRPEQTWLVDGMVPAGGIAVIFGASNSGKTFLAVNLAAAVALDGDFAGHKVRQGHVLYIGGEGLGSVAKRVEAAYASIASLDSSEFDDRTNFIEDPISFLEPEAVAKLVSLVTAMEKRPTLIILDPLIDFLTGGDENQSQDMQRFMANVKELRKKSGAAIVIVHHATKANAAVERGSSVLRAGADTMITVLETGTRKGSMACDKQRDAERFESIQFELEVVSLKPGCDKSERTSCVVHCSRLSGNKDPCSRPDWEQVREHLGKYAPHDGATVSSISDATGFAKKRVYKILNILEESGYVERLPGKRNIRFKLVGGGAAVRG